MEELIRVSYNKDTKVFDTSLNRMVIEVLPDEILEHLANRLIPFLKSEVDRVVLERQNKKFIQKMRG